MLDNYQRSFTRNIEFIKNSTQPLMDFNSSLKYFANFNTLQLKLNYESRRKSDWLSKTKKLMQSVEKNVESNSFANELSNTLSTFSRLKLDNWPTWKGDENSSERSN